MITYTLRRAMILAAAYYGLPIRNVMATGRKQQTQTSVCITFLRENDLLAGDRLTETGLAQLKAWAFLRNIGKVA